MDLQVVPCVWSFVENASFEDSPQNTIPIPCGIWKSVLLGERQELSEVLAEFARMQLFEQGDCLSTSRDLAREP